MAGFAKIARSAAGAMLVLILVLTGTQLGSMLNESTFLNPAMRIRAALGVRPKLDPRIRVVIFDDQSLQEMKRPPRANEWQRIAHELAGMGYERVLFDGLMDFTELEDVPSSVLFAAGVVNYPPSSAGSTYETKDLPARLIVPAEGRADALPESERLLGPNPAHFGAVSRYGALNVEGETNVPMGFYAPEQKAVIPYLGLYALPDLAWKDGRFVSSSGPVADPVDGLYHMDFVSPADVITAARRFRALIDPATGAIKLSAATKKHLTGGKVAILAPEGHTGSRFIDSPVDGKVPTYLGFVAVVNGLLSGSSVYRPWYSMTHGLVMLAVLCLTLLPWRFQRALLVTAGALLAHSLACFLLLHWQGWVLPAAEVGAVGALGMVWRAVSQYTRNSIEKARYEQDLEMGRTVQNLCLPKVRSVRRGNWEVAIRHLPFGPMYGDWFQLAVASDDKAGKQGDEVVVSIGDVAGKGPSAALATTVIATVWNRHAAKLKEDVAITPLALVTEIDEALRATFNGGQYSTASMAILGDASIRVSSFGSPPWLTFLPGAESSRIQVRRGDPLGFVSKFHKVNELTVNPQPGQIFVCFTDGVLEGVKALKQFVDGIGAIDARIAAGPVDELLDHLYGLANGVKANAAVPDDQTFLVIRYLPETAVAAA